MRTRLTELAVLGMALLLTLPAFADEAGSWTVQRLMEELAQVKHSQARFTERKYLKVLKTPLQSSGTLTYTAPGKLEKRTLKPRPEALLVDGDQVVIELGPGTRRTIRMADYPVLQGFLESIRATLGGDAATLERYYTVDLDGTRQSWQLFLVPRERAMREVISQIRIGGVLGRINLIEVQETKGDRSVMKVFEDGR
jgi:outer membrane lipoprotein-sorting protein